MHYAPWWLLLFCLPVAALAAYLALRGTDLSRRTLYALTILLSPVLVVGAAVVAVALSTALFALFEPAPEPSVLPARTEPSTPEPVGPTPAPEETVSEPTGQTASPAASPSASPAASPSASPAASSASPAAGE